MSQDLEAFLTVLGMALLGIILGLIARHFRDKLEKSNEKTRIQIREMLLKNLEIEENNKKIKEINVLR